MKTNTTPPSIDDSELKTALDRLIAYEKPVLGLSELAEILGISKQALYNRRMRTTECVQPDFELAMGPIWWQTTVLKWLQSYRREVV